MKSLSGVLTLFFLTLTAGAAQVDGLSATGEKFVYIYPDWDVSADFVVYTIVGEDTFALPQSPVFTTLENSLKDIGRIEVSSDRRKLKIFYSSRHEQRDILGAKIIPALAKSFGKRVAQFSLSPGVSLKGPWQIFAPSGGKDWFALTEDGAVVSIEGTGPDKYVSIEVSDLASFDSRYGEQFNVLVLSRGEVVVDNLHWFACGDIRPWNPKLNLWERIEKYVPDLPQPFQRFLHDRDKIDQQIRSKTSGAPKLKKLTVCAQASPSASVN